MSRAGFVALIGLPNVGKSTLLNRLLGQKIAIASPRPQTTRNRILGVRNLAGGQLVIVDTPGLPGRGGRFQSKNQLGRYMLDEALAALGSVDVVLVLIEAPHGPEAARTRHHGYRIGAEYDFVMKTLHEQRKPAVAAINKIDLLHDKQLLLPVLDAWQQAHPFAALVPISATTGDGVDELEQQLLQLVPESEPLFPEELLTDRAERWLAAEMVREQVFLLTRQEIPYATAVTIDTFEERGGSAARSEASEGDEPPPAPGDVVIHATIHVEKDAQKRIIVGEGGQMIREIGSRARREISQLLGCPVHLHLFVRVEPAWTATTRGLRKLGYQ